MSKFYFPYIDKELPQPGDTLSMWEPSKGDIKVVVIGCLDKSHIEVEYHHDRYIAEYVFYSLAYGPHWRLREMVNE